MIYLFHNWNFVPLILLPLFAHSPTPTPLATIHLSSVSEPVFVLFIYFFGLYITSEIMWYLFFSV